MKKNGYFLCILVLLCSATNTIETATTTQNQPLVRSLLIFIDTSETELSGIILEEFALALCQKAAPIIINKRMFYVLLASKSDQKMNKLREEIVQSIKDFDLYRSQEKKDSNDKLVSGGNYVLCIPKEYRKNLATEFPKLSEKERLGFNIDNAELFFDFRKNRDTSTLNIDSSKIDIKELAGLFLPSKNGLWNIYMTGHGKAPSSELGGFAQVFAHHNYSDMVNLTDFRASIGGLSVEQFRELIVSLQNINTNFLHYSSCYAGGYNLMVPYIVNLFVKQLLSEEEAEAMRPDLPKEKRAREISRTLGVLRLKPNFTISVGSAFDRSVTAVYDRAIQCYKSKDEIPAGYINFGKFFELLAEYTSTELKIAASAQPKPIIFKDSELRAILSKVIESSERLSDKSDPLGLASLPQVMFPNVGTFVLFPLDPQKIFVLSNVLIKGAKLEKKPIIISSNPSPEAVIMPVADMPVTLRITTEKMPALVSQLPGIGVHIIESIEAEKVPFTEFVRSFAFIDVAFQKYFFIKKVVIKKDAKGPLLKKDPLVLTDVLIAVLNSNVRMFFTVENSVYFTAAYLSGDKKKDTRIQSFMLQDLPVTTLLPIVPGSDAQMPDYLSLYKKNQDAVSKAFNDWNEHASSGVLGMKYILPLSKDRDFWKPLEEMSGEQQAKTERMAKKVEERKQELEKEKSVQQPLSAVKK